MSDTLLPCPRCGGAAVGDEPYPGDYDTGGIHCDDCGYWTGEDMDRDEAIEWWNTRPLVDRLQARIAELERVTAPAVTGVPQSVANTIDAALNKMWATAALDGDGATQASAAAAQTWLQSFSEEGGDG